MEYNEDQLIAEKILKDPKAFSILLFGATGSGKTFLLADWMLDRCAVAPGSRHLVLRTDLVDVRANTFNQTFKDVVNIKYADPKYEEETAWEFMRRKGMITLEPTAINIGRSRIDFKGIAEDDLDRMLGSDYITVMWDEVSTEQKWETIATIESRIRQKVLTVNGKPMRPKFVMTCNPPSKRHWTYPVFGQGLNYNTRQPHSDPEAYQTMRLRTEANEKNLVDGYIKRLANTYEADYVRRKRFLEGMWYDEVDNPLFSASDIQKYRLPPIAPEEIDAASFNRVIVAIDPAVTTNKGSDETGVIVLGEDEDREIHVLADLSGKYQPAQWGKVAIDALRQWKGNEIIAERNQGGDMVAATLTTIDPNVRVVTIHASRGKDIRAEASSTAYQQGRVHHRGLFRELEDQLVEFEVGFNRKKKGYSPDRLDALVHGINHLLGEKEKRGARQQRVNIFT